MYNKKRDKKKTIIEIVCISIILIVLLSISLLHPTSGSEHNILKNFAINVQKVAMYPFTHLARPECGNETESYTIQKNVNSSLEKEIQELKEMLELNKTLTEYEPINATILSRNKSYWFNTITIDKGTSSGIKKDMAVITKNGLIGKITSVSKNSSEVKLITTDDINFKVSIAVQTKGADSYAIMNGYDVETGLIKASGIDKMSKVKVGDTVLTSGLGIMFPAGIYIGTIEQVTSDKYDLSKTIYIKTQQDFNDIHYVTVLKVKQ